MHVCITQQLLRTIISLQYVKRLHSSGNLMKSCLVGDLEHRRRLDDVGFGVSRYKESSNKWTLSVVLWSGAAAHQSACSLVFSRGGRYSVMGVEPWKNPSGRKRLGVERPSV